MPTPFLKFCPTPPPSFPVTSNPHPPLLSSDVLFPWLSEWSRHTWCAILLNDIMDLNMSSFERRILISVLCNKAPSLLRSHTWYGFLLVLWFDILHKNLHKHSDYTQGPVDWHTHTSTYLHRLSRAHNSSLLHWIIHWYQKFTFDNVFSFLKLFTYKSHVFWLDAVRLDSSCETQIILIEMM